MTDRVPAVNWVTVKQAAAAHHRDISRLYAWIREGRITCRETDDGDILVSLRETAEFVELMNRRRHNKTRRPASAE